MRINNNIMSLNAQRHLGRNTNAQSKVLEKLSSGLAINRAADDAAGLSISQKMRHNIAALERSSKNAQDGISFIQAAEGALDEVSNMLTKITELAEQLHDGILTSANGTSTTAGTGDKDAINNEIKQLYTQINCIITDTTFNGIHINKNGIEFGINGTDSLLAVGTTMTTFTDTLAETLAVTTVKGNIDSVDSWRSLLGAQQNRLEYAKNNVDTNVENLTAAEARIRDADMAKMMSEFTKYNILTQAATSMLAQANSVPQSVLTLLQ